jgi:uridine phosphorylase
LPIRYPDLADRMARQGVVNFEMEASAVLTLAALAGCRAGVVCTVYAQRREGAFVTGEQKASAEAGLIDTGLEALHVLAEMDAQRARSGEKYWRPSHWAPDLAT